MSVSGINGTADGDTRTTLKGRPTDEEVRINRTLRPERFTIKYRRDRDLTHEGPAFNHAVALARKDHPGFLESTYRQAADVAYYNKERAKKSRNRDRSRRHDAR